MHRQMTNSPIGVTTSDWTQGGGRSQTMAKIEGRQRFWSISAAPALASTQNAPAVTLPPGRFMLATRPTRTGSPPTKKTMGIGEARTCCTSSSNGRNPPVRMITRTLRCVRSASWPEKRSYRPSVKRYQLRHCGLRHSQHHQGHGGRQLASKHPNPPPCRSDTQAGQKR